MGWFRVQRNSGDTRRQAVKSHISRPREWNTSHDSRHAQSSHFLQAGQSELVAKRRAFIAILHARLTDQVQLGAYALAPNITYGGSQWTAESNGLEVKGVAENGTQVFDVKNGKVVIDMPATSAALVWLL